MSSASRRAPGRELASLRLAAQRIRTSDLATPGDVVRHMMAMQAQDFPGAKWSVGLRCPGSTDSDIEAALESRQFVRSWPMRGTLHFIAGEDLRWMLALTTKRLLSGAARRREQLDLTERDLARAGEVATRELEGDRMLERAALLDALDRQGISTAGQRGYHILWYLAQTGLLVFGPVSGKQQTFVLLREWIPGPRHLERDESLGELAARYFRSHGPATVHDLAWWASLTLGEARTGLAIARPDLDRIEVQGTEYFMSPGLTPAGAGVEALPGFDEFMLGYRDRDAALPDEHKTRIVPGNNGVFLSTIVVDGQVVGTWRRTDKARGVEVVAMPFRRLAPRALAGFTSAVERYGAFRGKPVTVLPAAEGAP